MLQLFKDVYFVRFRFGVNRVLHGQKGGGNHDAHKDDVSKGAVIAKPVTEHPKPKNQKVLTRDIGG